MIVNQLAPKNIPIVPPSSAEKKYKEDNIWERTFKLDTITKTIDHIPFSLQRWAVFNNFFQGGTKTYIRWNVETTFPQTTSDMFCFHSLDDEQTLKL